MPIQPGAWRRHSAGQHVFCEGIDRRGRREEERPTGDRRQQGRRCHKQLGTVGLRETWWVRWVGGVIGEGSTRRKEKAPNVTGSTINCQNCGNIYEVKHVDPSAAGTAA